MELTRLLILAALLLTSCTPQSPTHDLYHCDLTTGMRDFDMCDRNVGHV